MLGRTSRASPQFISISDGSWLGTSAFIERMTQMSSMHLAVWENSSLTSMPLWPYFWNLNGEGNAAPVFRSVGKFGVGNSLPAYLASAGLGSNVSICDEPPLKNRWITRFAFAAIGAALGSSGLTPSAAAA